MEFHISREARDRYQVSDALFNFVGNVIFADLGSCREMALRMTEIRAASGLDPINPGALFAMGLIDEVSHFLVAQYRHSRDPQVTQAALDWFAARVGEDNVDKLLRTFVQEFPNAAIYRGEANLDQWLQGSTDGLAHREAVLEELMLLWLANQNPAFRPFPRALRRHRSSPKAPPTSRSPRSSAATSPRVPPPAWAAAISSTCSTRPCRPRPTPSAASLPGFAKTGPQYLGDNLRKVLLAADVLKEEEVAIWMRFHPTLAPSPPRSPQRHATTPRSPTSAVIPATSNTSASVPIRTGCPTSS